MQLIFVLFYCLFKEITIALNYLQSEESDIKSTSSSVKLESPYLMNFSDHPSSDAPIIKSLKLPNSFESFNFSISHDYSSTQNYISYTSFKKEGSYHEDYHTLINLGSMIVGCSKNYLQQQVKNVENMILDTLNMEKDKKTFSIY